MSSSVPRPRALAVRSPRTLVILLAVLALVASACSAAPGSASNAVAGATQIPGWPVPGQAATSGPVPVLASSELVVGKNRFLFTIVDSANNPIASPTLHTTVSFYDLDRDPAHPVTTADGRFLWAIPNDRGFYVAPVSFDASGHWGAEVKTAGTAKGGATADGSTRLQFSVLEHGTTVAVGEKAPDVATPTLASAGGDVHRISSDPNPDPAFYTTSVPDALAKHEPFVLVFATPAFCQSRVCGPTLDEVKSVAKSEPGMAFINVEPYELTYTGGRLQPVLDKQGYLTPTKVTDAWHLQQEPWIFVVDRNGVVTASFEAIVGVDELTQAIDAVR